MITYQELIAKKAYLHIEAGFDVEASDIPWQLRDFQRDTVAWACRRGRAAIFAGTGLGKTLMQLAWAHLVMERTDKPVLVVAPLCVAQQTIREGQKFGIEAEYIREPKFCNSRIHVINYEMLKHFNPDNYAGIVLDESSILKGMDGKMRRYITDFASTIPYRLSCTATPSPNDFMELGTQSEFLGIMTQVEMLAMFFIHDGSDTSKWRLKGHGRAKFWQWLATWSVVIRNPGDLGYSSEGYDLPELIYHNHVVETGENDGLFVKIAQGLQDRNTARRESVDLRVEKAAEIANSIDGACIVWCHLNDESQKLETQIVDGVQIFGAMKPEIKEGLITCFTEGEILKLITKPKIAGFGLNWQHCNHMIFVGLSDSWESFYQAVRRCWRFGQNKPVHVHIVTADTEGAVLENIRRKQQLNDEMSKEMAAVMRDLTVAEIKGATTEKTDYIPCEEMAKPLWA
jgi:superfamily II DNA or RNA helicase